MKDDKDSFKDLALKNLSTKVITIVKDHLSQKEVELIHELLLGNKLTQKARKKISDETNTLGSALSKIEATLEVMHNNSNSFMRLNKMFLKMQGENGPNENNQVLSPKTEKLLNTPLNTFAFSGRVKNIFERENLHIVSELLKLTPETFLEFRGSGKKCIHELETFFSENGLWWGKTEEGKQPENISGPVAF